MSDTTTWNFTTNKLGYLDKENITGTYGMITTKAVKKFQSDNGIEPTGFFGQLTRAKLEKS
ncbi:MAG TPA: peptidoglycan-binding domain-containing protein [Candidatus Moranbacteria bacterium]|nr:peptidoglycan-binding domain-containing protein [Candidatus Moranbacteria bacterium]